MWPKIFSYSRRLKRGFRLCINRELKTFSTLASPIAHQPPSLKPNLYLLIIHHHHHHKSQSDMKLFRLCLFWHSGNTSSSSSSTQNLSHSNIGSLSGRHVEGQSNPSPLLDHYSHLAEGSALTLPATSTSQMSLVNRLRARSD